MLSTKRVSKSYIYIYIYIFFKKKQDGNKFIILCDWFRFFLKKLLLCIIGTLSSLLGKFKYSFMNNFLSWWNYSQLRFNWTKYTIYIYIYIYIYKPDWILNNLLGLICNKTQTTYWLNIKLQNITNLPVFNII